jgi:hypothetical protein
MSALMSLERGDAQLTAEVLTHLETQIASGQELLGVVLAQGAAIRERNVQQVVVLTSALQTELQKRTSLELERAQLLERAGARLGIGAGAVTLERLTALMDPSSAAHALARSAELRGLLEVVQREHHVNRALMNQELAFLDHLLRLSGTGDAAYGATGERASVRPMAPGATRRVLDLEV